MRQNFHRFSIAIIVTLLFVSVTHAQWTQTNGPIGGSVGPFAVLGNRVFAGTTNGIFSSTDHGTSWTRHNGFNGVRYMTAMTTVGGAIIAAASDSVYRSLDTGATWQNITTGLPADEYHAAFLVIDTTLIVQEIFANTFYFSTDKGTTWKAGKKGWASYEQVWISAVMGSYLFAGTDSNLYRSPDKGNTWVIVKDSLPKAVAVATLGAVGTRLFASTNFGVFVSVDSGKVWSYSGQGLPLGQYLISYADMGSTILGSTFDNGIFASTDQGASWSAAKTGLVTVDARNGFAVIGNDVLVGTDIGVFRSTNKGGNWIFSNSGIINYTPVSGFARSGNQLVVSTHGRGIYRSSNDGDQWIPSNQGIVRDSIFISDLSHLIQYKGSLFTASTYEGSIFRSTNDGLSWTDIFPNRVITSAALYTLGDTKLFADVNDTLNLHAILYSKESITSWMQIYPGSQSIFSFAEMGSSLFAASSFGLVFRSTDDGAHWKIVNIPEVKWYVLSLAVMGTNLFAGTQDGAYVSSDEGASWKEINTGFTNLNVSNLLVIGTNLFATTLDGVFLTKDNGANWVNVSTGLPVGLPVAVLYASPTHLFCGVNFRGVWKRPLSEIID